MIKTHFLAIALCLFGISGFAQTPSDSTKKKETPAPAVDMPQFPGGQAALDKFLLANIRYPPAVREKGIEGKVVVSFGVEMNGTLTHIKVLDGLGKEIDEEILRVIKLMPKWIPARYAGNPVWIPYHLVIPIKIP